MTIIAYCTKNEYCNDINEFLHFNNPALMKQRESKIKSEKVIYERNLSHLDLIYSIKKPIYASDYKTYVFSISNLQDTNNIHLYS